MSEVGSVRRLRRGEVSVEMDYDAEHVLLRCGIHNVDDRVLLRDETLGALLVGFFRSHKSCSSGAGFDILDTTRPAGATQTTTG